MENKNTKYIFMTLSTYIMSPFDFVYAGMGCHDAIEIDVGALADGLRVQWTAEADCRLGYVC